MAIRKLLFSKCSDRHTQQANTRDISTQPRTRKRDERPLKTHSYHLTPIHVEVV